MTRVHHNPDSWEGWYWGAVHHWGHTLRVGQSETYGTVEDCLQNCDMIVFWAADPETTSGSYGAQEGTVRRQWLKNPKLGIKVVHVDPYYNAVGAVPAGQVVRAEADHIARDGDGDRLRLDQGRPLRQGIRRDAHRRLRQVGGLSHRRRGRHRRRRRSGRRRKPAFRRKDVRALAREWGKKRVYLAPGGWGNGHGGACRNQTGIQWARVMVCLSRDAGARQARLQHGQSAMGLPGRLQFLFPRLLRRRHVGRPGEHRDAGRALPAHAATADHELQRPADSAHLAAGGDLRRQGRGLPLGRQVDRAPVRQVHVSGARPFAGAHALQVRRLDPRHHEQHQPPCADVPVGEPGVRGQPVDLVRGRGEVRRRHPAGLHQLRAHRHLRMGGARRLRPSRPAAAQPPRHHLPVAGDRAARRVEVRLLDLQRNLQAARPVATTSPRAATRSTGSSASISPPTCRR